MENFEKLGAFYLGRPYDLKNQKPKEGAKAGQLPGHGAFLELQFVQMPQEIADKNAVNGLQADFLWF